MTKTVDEMIADILKNEGGYVDNPNDKGGATNHGVSLRYARRVGLAMDLDGDGDVDAHDIRMVTPAKAAELYKKDFLIAPGFHKLPVEIQPQVFDMAVLHGPNAAGKMLQDVLNEVVPDQYRLKADGLVGPRTYQALDWLAQTNKVLAWGIPPALKAKYTVSLNNALVQRRSDYMRDIVRRDPSQKVFIKGWLRRAESFREI